MAHKFQGDILVKGSVQLPNESADKALVINASGELESSVVTTQELEYLSGVTGDLQVQLNSVNSALDAHEALSSGVHGVTGSVVGTSDSQALTNKTINADLNTISNIDNADIKAGAAIDASKIADGSVSNTEFQYLGGVTGDLQVQLNDIKDDVLAVEQDVADLVTLSGVAANSVDLGTFTGSTIQDNATIKEALQDLETEVELKANDADVLKKDGSVAMTGDLNLGGNDINNVASVNAPTGSNLVVKASASQSVSLETQSANAGVTAYSSTDILDAYGNEVNVSAQDALSVYTNNGNVSIYSQTLATGQVRIYADGASGEVRIGLDAGGNPLDNVVKIGGAELEISSDVIDFTNTRLENVADPTADQDAATKAYVDNAIAGLRWKQPVKAASTADLSLTGEQTVDTVALVAGDRVLVKNQNDETENGIYVVASGAWSRAVDADNSPSEELLKAAVFVIDGSQATTGWVNSNLGPITIGVTEITFVQFSATVSAYVGGDGIDVTGPTISVDHDGQGLAFSAGELVLELDGSTLSKSASGLKVADAGITNTQVAANAAIELSKLEALTANRAVQTDASGELVASSVTSTELGYVSGVTGSLQVQLNALSDEIATKQDDVITTQGDLVVGDAGGQAERLPVGADGQVLTVSGTDVVWSTPVASADEKVKVSANDTTAKYLEDAVVTPSSGGLALQTLNDGGNEDLQIALDIPGMVSSSEASDSDNLLIYDASEAAHRKQTRAVFLSGVAKASAGDIVETSFSMANNQVSAANVTGFAFANATVRSFKAVVSVEIDATADLFEVFDIQGIQKGSSWDMAVVSTGDNSGVTFSITNAGQVQYTSSNLAGFSSGLIKFRAITTTV